MEREIVTGINYIILNNYFYLDGRSDNMLPLFVNPILIAAAVIPAIILLFRVYQADKLEKEPSGLLVSLVLYGVLATVLALGTELLGGWFLAQFIEENTVLYRVLFYFVVVACSEEGFKYTLLKKKTWSSPAFNCQFDGVVYAVFVSLGFALWENIGYVTMYGLEIAILRAITAIPGHACFGVFMGVWYGFAKKYEQCGAYSFARQCRIIALVLPIFLHGSYDFIATIENLHYAWIFVAFIVVLFTIAFRLVKTMSEHDCYIRRNSPFRW